MSLSDRELYERLLELLSSPGSRSDDPVEREAGVLAIELRRRLAITLAGAVDRTERMPRDWRNLGFRTIVRGDVVFLVRADRGAELPAQLAIFSRPVAGGAWLSTEPPPSMKWIRRTLGFLSAPLRGDIERTVRWCYCDQAVNTCDFCSGLRPAPTEAKRGESSGQADGKAGSSPAAGAASGDPVSAVRP